TPSDEDVFVTHFPTFEAWIKKLGDRHEKMFHQEAPWDFAYALFLLTFGSIWNLGNDKEISGENKHEEGMKKLSEPFRELSETVVPDIESQTLEHKIKKLQESIQHIDSSWHDSSRELTIKEFYKVLKERNVTRKKIVCLENHERYIEPIEEEIQEL
ncbi:18748_t:CDS:2, partial [Acaulospora morrowiae]